MISRLHSNNVLQKTSRVISLLHFRTVCHDRSAHVEGMRSLTEQHMALKCESPRTPMLKIKHVSVMMEVGAQGRIGKKI